jgi:hypothetical protein
MITSKNSALLFTYFKEELNISNQDNSYNSHFSVAATFSLAAPL